MKKVRTFLNIISWNKILTFFIFLLLSLVFWILQIVHQKFDKTIVYPIEYTNIPDSIIFKKELPDSIKLSIRNDGSDIVKYILFTKKNKKLYIDVRKMIKSTSPDDFLNQLIKNELGLGEELINYQPKHISLSYDLLCQQKEAVIYTGFIKTPLGYTIDGIIHIKPDSVVAYGSKASLDKIRYVKTVPDTLYNITSSNISVPLQNIKGVKFSTNLINLKVPIDQFAEKTVEVPIEYLNLPSHLFIKLFPSKVKIKLLVGLKRFDSLNANLFKAKVDFRETTNGEKKAMSVFLTDTPSFIKIKSIIPSRVEYLLER